MYKIILPDSTMKSLWQLKHFCAKGPIVEQIRSAVDGYIQAKEAEIGCPVSEIQEILEKHDKEENQDYV